MMHVGSFKLTVILWEDERVQRRKWSLGFCDF